MVYRLKKSLHFKKKYTELKIKCQKYQTDSTQAEKCSIYVETNNQTPSLRLVPKWMKAPRMKEFYFHYFYVFIGVSHMSMCLHE